MATKNDAESAGEPVVEVLLGDVDDDGKIPLPKDAPLRDLPDYSLPAISGEHITVSDPLTTYLAQLRNIPPLPAEEQQRLAELFVNEEDLEAARKLIMSNLRLVVKIAREYHRRRNSLMELIQEGNVGLAEAIRRYDPYRGVKFTSYAQYWIRAMILNYLMNVMQLVKVGSTRSGRKLFYNLRKAREQLVQEGYLTPTTRQIADHLGVKESEVIDVARILDQPAVSLDQPAPGVDATPLQDIIPDQRASTPEEEAQDNDLRARVRDAVTTFERRLNDEREIAIWRQRVVAEDPMSLQELGDQFEVSRERIRQIEKGVKNRFRRFWIDTVGEDEAAVFFNDD